MVSIATTHHTSGLTAPSLPPSKMAAPSSSPVSILKSSSLIGKKRKMDEVDRSLSPPSSIDGISETAPISRKRPRVTFNESIQTREIAIDELPPTPPTTIKSLAVIREEVRGAIYRHVTSSDTEGYNQIKEIFAADPRKPDDAYEMPSHSTLRNHLMALVSHISSLDRNCSSLVSAILDSEWVGRDEAYVKLFIRFLGNLCAAQGTYLALVLKMLTSKLTGVPHGTGRLPGYPIVQPSEIYRRVHLALRHVTRLVPSASGALSPILSQQFPYETDPAKCFIAYTRNLLQIIPYIPELQGDILSVITDKLVKVDVQIQIDLEEFEDLIGEELTHQSSPDPDEELEDDDDSVPSDDEDEENQRVQLIKESIHKVDGMIDLLFDYYKTPFETGSETDKENALDLLLSHFQSIILPTYHSRHTQFLLFHFSQCSPALVDRFASACIQLIFNKLQPGIMRQSAAAYLASFVARGAHIASDVVRDVFDLLLMHLNTMRRDYENGCRGPDLRRYAPFYSTAQAILYIFCFRWRDLTNASIEGDSIEQIEELEPSQITFPPNVKEFLHKAIYSRLNPLKICSPGIVTEFARIAHHFQLLYVYSLIETNKRLRITGFRSISSISSRDVHAGDHLGYQLDAYFPFDPYQLPRSRRWLEGDYVEWRGVPGLDDSNDSDSGADDDDDDNEDGTATDDE
ncbi:hypothetical protein N7495_007592 [Penicillium taxi]|uniref:uncharacterized protein n=1 Tax=Penicillium taxi TaxID=168475 RepID=UPI002545AD9C|nr:uncharacterized protein N7495_007592 [Penicillium taxi]KAJ5887551.1 hypothetical protein N7495_007592 [Penicillium taxi]